MAISVLFIEGDAAHAQAMCDRVASEGLDWRLEVTSSLAGARQHLAKSAFDALVVSSHLPDGPGDALSPFLEKTPSLLLLPEGHWLDSVLLLRQGFTDFLPRDAAHHHLGSLSSRILMAMERHHMLRQLRQRSETLEVAVAGAEVGVWDWRVPEDRNVVNERWCEMLGYAPEEVVLVGGVWMDWVHPQDLSRLKSALGPGRKTPMPQCDVEFRMRHRQGHWVWIHSRGQVVEQDAQGMPTRVAGTHSDITLRKKTEHVREQQTRMLQAISSAHDLFLGGGDTRAVFEGLLAELLNLTQSGYGFVGEVLYDTGSQPFIKAHAITNIAWDQATRQLYADNLATGMEFHNLKTLFGAALLSGEPVISNEPAVDHRKGGIPNGHPSLDSFLGIPIHQGNELVAMIGLANKPGGYSQADVDFLAPLSRTIGHLVGAWRSDRERQRAQAALRQTGDLLALQTESLEVTLDSINQGICTLEADGRISVINRRLQDILELPEDLIRPGLTAKDVHQFQCARGDFGDDFDLVDADARQYVRVGGGASLMESPELYLRTTRSGRTLEIQSRRLPDGGMVRTFTDITQSVQIQAELAKSEARFRGLTELSSDWYWEQDEHYRFLRLDGEFVEMTGLPKNAYEGMTRWEIGAENLTDVQWAAHRADLDTRRTFRDFEICRRNPEGNLYWISVSGTPIFDEAGVFQGYRGVGRNITENKKAEDQIERLAFFDALTELPNRRMLIERLHQAMLSSARSQQYAALLFIDLDNFKTLNDTYGHYMGDLLLQQVAARLRSSVREVDTVARLGGDEFVVMVEELSPDETLAAAQVKAVGEKIVAALNQTYLLPGQEHHSTPSVGVTLFLGQRETSDELLKRADVAMYQAKAAGRNTLRFFDPAMQAALAVRAELDADLRLCLQRDELVLYYQPVVDVDRVITGVEALVRWHHPVRGLVMPVDFIGLAEQSGLILSLGQWVLRAACEQLVAWRGDNQTRDLTMSVNVSERQMRQADFVGKVCDVLAQTGADPALLKLEITESLLLSDAEDIIVKMGALKTIGVRFSLDDFGTGYSSLGYLKRLPIDQLKIDQSFVQDVLTDPNDAAIAQTILALAGSLGLQVVAEGVETEGQLKFLLQSGCRSFQGNYFGRPKPIAHLNAWLNSAETLRA